MRKLSVVVMLIGFCMAAMSYLNINSLGYSQLWYGLAALVTLVLSVIIRDKSRWNTRFSELGESLFDWSLTLLFLLVCGLIPAGVAGGENVEAALQAEWPFKPVKVIWNEKEEI